jgi:hypothetical protein
MKKIVLNVEALEVESFAPETAAKGGRGTVQGHATLRCDTYYCSIGYNTCAQASCVDTCGYPYKPMC